MSKCEICNRIAKRRRLDANHYHLYLCNQCWLDEHLITPIRKYVKRDKAGVYTPKSNYEIRYKQTKHSGTFPVLKITSGDIYSHADISCLVGSPLSKHDIKCIQVWEKIK